ncbi:MAG TPA: hypothetical protein VJ793_14285 [Anaerolineae bacterium]|nr:hypothetical protein [Anaerolineae bacterium]
MNEKENTTARRTRIARAGGIACFTTDCNEAVTGQCTGYEGSCGRFYCSIHSTGTLCAICAARKLNDELARQIYQDYLQTAEQLQKEVREAAMPVSIIGSLIMILILLSQLGNSANFGSAFAWMLLIGGGFAIGALIIQQNKEQARLPEISKIKPDFPAFYKEWKVQKNKEALKTGLAVAGVLAVIVFGVAAAATKRDRR